MTIATTGAGGSRRTRSGLVALAVVLVLGTAGCGGADDEVAAPVGGDTEQTEQTPAPAGDDTEPTPTPTGDGAGETDDGTAETPAPAGDNDAAGDPVTFVAVDIAYDRAPDELTSGEHVFRLENEGLLPHNVTIEELDDRTVVHVSGGETGTGQVELPPGTYTYYCDVPGHRLAGMEGTFEVTEQAG